MPTIETSVAELGAIQFAEGAAPATPAAGMVRLYAKTDGTLYSKDDAGSETPLGAGAGATDFTDLGDVPAAYTGHAGKAAVVTGTEDGLEFVAVASSAAVAAVSPLGKHAVPVMAGAIAPSVSGGCAALAAVASAANQPDIVTLDFDATTVEYAQFAIPMPKSWDEGTITAQFRWSHASTTTNFGVVWGIQAVAVSDDDAIAVAFGTAQTVADTGGTTNDLYVTAETAALTVAGTPAAGDTVFFRVYRLSTDGSDTLAIDARLHSVVLFLTTNAGTDA